MYPFLRLAKEMWASRGASPLPLTGTHVSRHVCWPWDLDPWRELNNGRTLTLYDLGRLPLVRRTGLMAVLRANGWGLTVAGVSFRYRRRIRAFDRFELRSRCIGWDARFVYIEQAMFRDGECVSHGLYRSAVTFSGGIVPTSKVIAAFDGPMAQPELPTWARAWIAAEAERPWPPGI